MPDTKIFIDTDEEITFIAEKIKQSPTQNVVVIVPDRASIFITSASLKLLKKVIDRLDKKVIMVTMDESGKKMAESMNISTAYRVRDVTPELWSTVKKFPTAVKKHPGQKNNVYREIPEKIVPKVEETIKEPEVIEPVLPNAVAEKFEFPNETKDSADLEKSISANENDETGEEKEIIDIVNENPSDQISEEIIVSDEKIAEEMDKTENTSLENEQVNPADSDTDFLREDDETQPGDDLLETINENKEPEILDANAEFKIPHVETMMPLPDEEPIINKVELLPNFSKNKLDNNDVIDEEDDDEFVFVLNDDIANHHLKKKIPKFRIKQ